MTRATPIPGDATVQGRAPPAAPRRLTVVRIIDRLNVGGPAIHAVLTAGGLDRERFRTILIVGSVEVGEADMSYLLESRGIECVVIPSLGRELRPLRDIVTAWRLFQVMRRERPDIVHTHKAKAGALGRAVAVLLGVPVIVHTFHGHVLRGYFGPAKTRLFLGLEQLLARFTTTLIALSDRLVTELADELRVAPRERFHIVPLGFDLAPFAACQRSEPGANGVLRSQLGVGSETQLLAIIGRMVPVKDHDTFVAAAAELARVRDDVHFVFIGGGELEEHVRQDIAARGLSSRAHFLGWRRDLAPLYADLDVVVLSSINEGTPVALIEAMASGVPVVSTNVGGVPDLLDHGRRGEIVPPRDPAALAAGMNRALSPESRARAVAIRPEILRDFGAPRLFGDLERLYLKLFASAAEGKPRAV
jgi:glycosyltransferase involved in cell wall biosynthesis